MEEKVIIRKAKPSDLPEIQKLSKGLCLADSPLDKDFQTDWPFSKEGEKYLLRRIRGKKGICLAAEMNGKLIGYATGGMLGVESWRPIKRSELDNIFILDTYRSHGVGKQLMDVFFAWSIKKGAERVLVHVMAGNSKAITFYEKNKFSLHHVAMERKLITR